MFEAQEHEDQTGTKQGRSNLNLMCWYFQLLRVAWRRGL